MLNWCRFCSFLPSYLPSELGEGINCDIYCFLFALLELARAVSDLVWAEMSSVHDHSADKLTMINTELEGFRNFWRIFCCCRFENMADIFNGSVKMFSKNCECHTRAKTLVLLADIWSDLACFALTVQSQDELVAVKGLKGSILNMCSLRRCVKPASVQFPSKKFKVCEKIFR